MKTTHRKTLAVASAIAATIALSATSCAGSPSTREENETQRTQGVQRIVKNQPVKPMEWSPTRDTVNRWSETWGQEGKVSYVYMINRDGKHVGYYVISGLPVNYCVSATPVEEEVPVGGGSGPNVLGTAPALDGAYYGGCDASRYYGFDVVTGQYMEWTDGSVLTAFVTDQPLSLKQQPTPYGSSIEDVKKSK